MRPALSFRQVIAVVDSPMFPPLQDSVQPRLKVSLDKATDDLFDPEEAYTLVWEAIREVWYPGNSPPRFDVEIDPLL